MSRPITPLERMAGTTGLEPATSAVTGQRSNQLNYVPLQYQRAISVTARSPPRSNFPREANKQSISAHATHRKRIGDPWRMIEFLGLRCRHR